MFPEYGEVISRLKLEDTHFARLFDKHNELDHKIKAIEANIELGTVTEVENLKKEKLRLKDELYLILKQAEDSN